jgi:hypothetical protein
MGSNHLLQTKFLLTVSLTVLLLSNFSLAEDSWQSFVVSISDSAEGMCDSARDRIQKINELESRVAGLKSSPYYKSNYSTYDLYITSYSRIIVDYRKDCRIYKTRCEIRRKILDACFRYRPSSDSDSQKAEQCYNEHMSCDRTAYYQGTLTASCSLKRKVDFSTNCG